MKDDLHQAASKTSSDKLSFLKLKSVFGDLSDHERFTKEYTHAIDTLYANPDLARQMQATLSGKG